MQEWLKISLILCTFGFFREFRPSEPFVTEFLAGEWRNLTKDQLNFEVYPIGTYSTLALLVVVFLITDCLRYKPVIIASSCSAIAIYSMLLWTTSLLSLQIVEIFYGFYRAAEVAYFTYMYAKVNKDKYQKVTGNARSAHLSGRFISSIVAQLLYSFKIMDVRQLNYLTLGAQIVSLVVAVLLPPVGISLYFYTIPEINENSVETEKLKPKFSYKQASSLLWKHFKDAYSNPVVIQWSLWWTLSMGGSLMVLFYIQLLYLAVDNENDRSHVFNAGVEAILTLLGALSAFIAGYFTSKMFKKYDLLVLTICSLLQGAMVIISSQTTSIWTVYVLYIMFGVFFNFLITFATATVAKELADDSFALIFGINTLIAVGLQTIMTFVIMTWLNLNARMQYFIFGNYFFALGAVFLVAFVAKIFYGRNKKKIGHENGNYE